MSVWPEAHVSNDLKRHRNIDLDTLLFYMSRNPCAQGYLWVYQNNINFVCGQKSMCPVIQTNIHYSYGFGYTRQDCPGI